MHQPGGSAKERGAKKAEEKKKQIPRFFTRAASTARTRRSE
jgi:hypothetical protein